MKVENREKVNETVPVAAGTAKGHTVDHPFIMNLVDEFLYDGGKYHCTVLELNMEGSLQALLDQGTA